MKMKKMQIFAWVFSFIMGFLCVFGGSSLEVVACAINGTNEFENRSTEYDRVSLKIQIGNAIYEDVIPFDQCCASTDVWEALKDEDNRNIIVLEQKISDTVFNLLELGLKVEETYKPDGQNATLQVSTNLSSQGDEITVCLKSFYERFQGEEAQTVNDNHIANFEVTDIVFHQCDEPINQKPVPEQKPDSEQTGNSGAGQNENPEHNENLGAGQNENPAQKPAAEEKPAAEQKPAVEQKPAAEQKPAPGQKPNQEQSPTPEQSPTSKQEPTLEQKPTGEQEPTLEQKPTGEQKPTLEQKPTGEQKPNNDNEDKQYTSSVVYSENTKIQSDDSSSEEEKIGITAEKPATYEEAKQVPISDVLYVSFGEGNIKVSVDCKDATDRGNDKSENGSQNVVKENGDGKAVNASLTNFENVWNAVLTEEEKEAVQSGQSLEVRFSVENINQEIAKKEKDAIEKLAEKIATEVEGFTVGAYLDLAIEKRIGDGEWESLSQLNEDVEITIAIPQELQQEGLQYWVIRNHDGEVTFLKDLDSNPDTITIQSGQFSTYAIAFAFEVQAAGTYSDSLLSGDQTIKLEEASSGIYWWILGMVVILVIAGLIGFFIYQRETEEEEE